MTGKKDVEYEIGGDNVFAGLGLDDAGELLTRAQEIAELLGMDQAEVSRLISKAAGFRNLRRH
ncbi:MAG: hypothetical protein ABSC93_25365 [Bryobacteraceae bacterium]|jgi:hypothetical protein